MNTLERFTRKWNLARWVGALGLVFVWVIFVSGKQPPAAKTSGQDRVGKEKWLDVIAISATWRYKNTAAIPSAQTEHRGEAGPVRSLLGGKDPTGRLWLLFCITSSRHSG